MRVVLTLERFPQQWFVLELKHPQAKIEAGPPVGVDLFQLVGTERCALDSRARGAVRGDCGVITNFLCYSCHDSDTPFTGNARPWAIYLSIPSIILLTQSGMIASQRLAYRRAKQPSCLAHDGQIFTGGDDEDTRRRGWQGDVSVRPASFVGGSVELQP